MSNKKEWMSFIMTEIKKVIAVDKKIINTKRLHNKHIALAVPTRREAHLLRIE